MSAEDIKIHVVSAESFDGEEREVVLPPEAVVNGVGSRDKLNEVLLIRDRRAQILVTLGEMAENQNFYSIAELVFLADTSGRFGTSQWNLTLSTVGGPSETPELWNLVKVEGQQINLSVWSCSPGEDDINDTHVQLMVASGFYFPPTSEDAARIILIAGNTTATLSPLREA